MWSPWNIHRMFYNFKPWVLMLCIKQIYTSMVNGNNLNDSLGGYTLEVRWRQSWGIASKWWNLLQKIYFNFFFCLRDLKGSPDSSEFWQLNCYFFFYVFYINIIADWVSDEYLFCWVNMWSILLMGIADWLSSEYVLCLSECMCVHSWFIVE